MKLNSLVKSDPSGVVKGRFLCTVTGEGLSLKQGKKPPINIPVGVAAKYLGKNRFEVALTDYRLEIAVARLGSYNNRLAKDLAGFLQGTNSALEFRDYALPWYFFSDIASAPWHPRDKPRRRHSRGGWRWTGSRVLRHSAAGGLADTPSAAGLPGIVGAWLCGAFFAFGRGRRPMSVNF